MKSLPITTFRKVLKHLELSYDEALLANCLYWSHFETMKAEEQAMEGGYVESTNRGDFSAKAKSATGQRPCRKKSSRKSEAAFPT